MFVLIQVDAYTYSHETFCACWVKVKLLILAFILFVLSEQVRQDEAIPASSFMFTNGEKW